MLKYSGENLCMTGDSESEEALRALLFKVDTPMTLYVAMNHLAIEV